MSEPEEFPIKHSFIEKTFPVKEVSEEPAREKDIRHVSTLYIYGGQEDL